MTDGKCHKNKELETFIKTYLHLEQAYDTGNYLRPTLMAFKESYVESVRDGLSDILHQKSITIADYERLTDIEFLSDETLYGYLQQIYAYLFERAPKRPLPPE
ncbi:hypothetical protein [Streptomyces sp. NPDC090053]|uniref:hypothetical protein n=1 Tax=Streptomyces sp. NPDC090053 TaxID=3365932 RepID=UPI0037F1C253